MALAAGDGMLWATEVQNFSRAASEYFQSPEASLVHLKAGFRMWLGGLGFGARVEGCQAKHRTEATLPQVVAPPPPPTPKRAP